MTLTPRQFELLSSLRASELDDPRRDAEVDALAATLAAIEGSDIESTELSELRELRRRNSEWDDAIRSALHEVPVPAGLHARLRHELALPEPALTGSHSAARTIAAQVVEPQRSASPQPVTVVAADAPTISRRAWLGKVAALGAATCAGAAVIWYSQRPRFPELTDGELLSAGGWLNREIDSTAWTKYDPNAEETALAEYPLPREIAWEPNHWQTLHSDTLSSGVAYDYTTDAGRAALFVIPQPVDRFDSRPPLRPQATTQGVCVGYWQEGERLFVLVVEGFESRYRRFFNTRAGGTIA